jgi:diaminopimelate epimerase
MGIRFAKMHGLGNDFVVIDAVRQSVALDPETVRWLADRHFGVGCDQVLLVEAATRTDADLRYRIYNADGGEVEQCGNGARCFALFARAEGLTTADQISVETAAGLIRPTIRPDGQVEVEMGRPRFAPPEVPFLADRRRTRYRVPVGAGQVEIGAVSLGNPHAVVRVPDVDAAPVQELGPLLQSHAQFPERANVGFVEVLARDHIRLRVFERGVGETLACGTGACAAVAVGRDQQLLDPEVAVDLPGGRLQIVWAQEDAPMRMIGPAVRVFDGSIEL